MKKRFNRADDGGGGKSIRVNVGERREGESRRVTFLFARRSNKSEDEEEMSLLVALIALIGGRRRRKERKTAGKTKDSFVQRRNSFTDSNRKEKDAMSTGRRNDAEGSFSSSSSSE